MYGRIARRELTAHRALSIPCLIFEVLIHWCFTCTPVSPKTILSFFCQPMFTPFHFKALTDSIFSIYLQQYGPTTAAARRPLILQYRCAHLVPITEDVDQRQMWSIFFFPTWKQTRKYQTDQGYTKRLKRRPIFILETQTWGYTKAKYARTHNFNLFFSYRKSRPIGLVFFLASWGVSCRCLLFSRILWINPAK